MLLLSDKVAEHYDQLNFYKGIQMIQTAIRQTNSFYQYHKPWTHTDSQGKANSEDDQRQLDTTIHVTYQTLRLCGLLLQPILPCLADRVLNRLGIPKSERSFEFCRVFEKCPVPLEDKPLGCASSKVIFARLKESKEK